MIRCAGRVVALFWSVLAAQTFTQRGFIDTQLWLYPEAAPNDSGRAVDGMLLRYEPSWRPVSWLKLNASFDARVDTHNEVDRSLRLDWRDRTLERPALSVRRLSAIVTKGKLTAEFGKQFIRWGKADILNPTDRFAPKDFLNVVDTEILAVMAARLTYDTGRDSFDVVWQPLFTPSRTPLINQRWTVLPAGAAGIQFDDLGAQYPERSAFGARWNHTGSGYELSLSYYDGSNNLPLFNSAFAPPARVSIERVYPPLRFYGADAAVPLKWFTFKTEEGYYTSPDRQEDEYLIYVLQLERQVHEWTFVGGYAGEVLTSHSATFQFSPERGFARAFLGRAFYQIDPNRSVSVDAAVRQNGRGSLVRAEYSQTFGQHWRGVVGFAWLRGDETDFLGQFHRNSHAIVGLRYSF